MNFIQDKYYSAVLNITDKFICINTRSGNGILTTDTSYSPILLPLDCSNYKLGEELIKALECSNTQLCNEEYDKLFKNVKENWNSRLEVLKSTYSYRSKRQLLANMLNCSVYLLNNKLTIQPTHHSKWEGWEGVDESKHVILSLDNTFDEIGSGVRLALSRCTSKKF
ncbi:contact-dependent growth inhibition system immunity protein [Providencia rettgeri]|uniref:contact-dependent growth inhibition system immunity protein n=1 Tax=Providencia TaxID=586 RepID=UPI0018C6A440|nr:contact-dependent growth inhibition system immunity protein [Providencia rettgeri]MBG5929406.1 CdiI family contact-dependent growth inhibition immunity protein [Providencia rettgeri]